MIKKLYSYNNNRDIWRIIPTGEENLLIEERNKKTKEVFFNCINIQSGKKLLNSFQLEDKYWIGVEAVQNHIIFFHRFIKPDLPTHKDIIAFDIKKKKILWENNDLTFLNISNNFLLAYKSLFEGREYYKLDIETGNILEELKDTPINKNADDHQNNTLKDFIFSSIYSEEMDIPDAIKNYIKIVKENNVVVGKTEFIVQKSTLLISFHSPTINGKLNKLFNAIDIVTGKVILNKIINSNIEAFVPDSFFVVKNFLFVIWEAKKLVCFNIL